MKPLRRSDRANVRIALLNWSSRIAGGIETYLSAVIPELARIGCEVGFWYEVDAPRQSAAIPLDAASQVCSVEESGRDGAIASLRAWQPDVLYSHGLLNPEFESETLSIAPAVFFAHAYYGTCISGAKTFKNPTVMPCHRQFGPSCLLHYYPHRCGGWSPVTMVREYRRQHDRLEMLARYKTIVTHSKHMVDEYAAHGLRVRQIALPVRCPASSSAHDSINRITASDPEHVHDGVTPVRLLFVGRMDLLKGGRIFLDALPGVVDALKRPVRVVFAGEGPDRVVWERRARRLCIDRPDVTVRFAGWRSSSDLDALLNNSDLLVLPSLWPEPFGLVGLEAGLHGVPVAAFAVGGITDWLSDGVNGSLASGTPPTCEGLTDAIVRCLADLPTHARLRRGALEIASRFTMNKHLTNLLPVLQATAETVRPASREAHDVRHSPDPATFSRAAANP
jgi:glycosyltransferase involved in cell wall biosynthesis